MPLEFRPGARILIAVQPFGASFAGALKRLSEDARIQIFECETANEATSIVQHVDGALILVHIENSEGNRHFSLVKALTREIRSRRVRFIAVTASDEPSMISRLSGTGFSEVIPEPISGKTLAFKLERHLRTIPVAQTAPQETESSPDQSGDASVSQAPAAGLQRASRQKNSVVRVAPLEIQSDVWTSGKSGVKRIGGRWVVRMYGPPPSYGHWAEATMTVADKDERARYWQWMPNDGDNDPFIREQGAWIFRGQKPEFQDEMWTFIDKHPELIFVYEAQSYGTKFKVEEDGSLLLAQDSTQAKDALSRIREELEKSMWRNPDEAARSSGDSEREKGAEESFSSDLEKSGTDKGDAVTRFVDALALESDCWTLGKNRPRRVMGRWLTRLAGPPPKYGRWLDLESRPETAAGLRLEPPGTDGERYFEWVPVKEEGDPFIKEQGSWIFRGFQPRFEDDTWLFAGKYSTLAFYFGGDCYGFKLVVQEDGCLQIARDSKAAERALPEIRAALEKVIHQERGEDEEAEAVLNPAGGASGGGETGISAENAPEAKFRYPDERFGTPGGKWEFASANARGKKWFVYVPIEVLNHVVTDVKSLPIYWLFEGLERPAMAANAQRKEWIFRGWEPEPIDDFAKLPKVVRNYLLDRAPQPVYTDTREGSETKGPRRGASRKSLKKSGPRPADEGPEPETEVIGAAAQAEDLAATEIREGVEDGMHSGPPVSLDGAPVPLEEVRRAALAKKAPSISPLALAFLISELATRRDLLREQVAQRYCAYVSSSAGGARTELWANQGGIWICVATHDGSGGTHRDTLSDAAAASRESAKGTRVAQVEGLGALVVEGGGPLEIHQGYAEGAARMAMGLLRHFAEGAGAGSKAA